MARNMFNPATYFMALCQASNLYSSGCRCSWNKKSPAVAFVNKRNFLDVLQYTTPLKPNYWEFNKYEATLFHIPKYSTHFTNIEIHSTLKKNKKTKSCIGFSIKLEIFYNVNNKRGNTWRYALPELKNIWTKLHRYIISLCRWHYFVC